MAVWQSIDTAPKDGSTVRVKRVYQRRVIYDGPAAWRTVHFDALYDPITKECFAEARDDTGWMYPAGMHEKRVPEPTHWLPE